jgi:dihydrofolate reductase
MGPVRGPWTGHRRGHTPHQVAGRPQPYLWGSSTLTSTLLEHGLADEVLLVVYPVLLGTGKRFFAEGTPARAFELISTNVTPTGIILSHYKVVGALKAG